MRANLQQSFVRMRAGNCSNGGHMAYKVLEQNGIDNENVDGGAFNRFTAGMEDVIVKGVFSECALVAAGSGVGIGSGLIIVCGIRVKVISQENLYLSGKPATATKYQIIVQATLESNRNLTVSFLLRSSSALRQDNLYAAESGVYQAEIGTFLHNTDGSISELTRTMEVVAGSSGIVKSVTVGKTTTLPAGSDATVENVGTDKKLVLDFGIPRGKDGNNLYSFQLKEGCLWVTSAIADENQMRLVDGYIIFG